QTRPILGPDRFGCLQIHLAFHPAAVDGSGFGERVTVTNGSDLFRVDVHEVVCMNERPRDVAWWPRTLSQYTLIGGALPRSDNQDPGVRHRLHMMDGEAGPLDHAAQAIDVEHRHVTPNRLESPMQRNREEEVGVWT